MDSFRRLVLSVSLLALIASGLACSSSSSPAPTATTSRYVGTLAGTNVVVGLAVTDGNALLFFCGADATLTTMTHWMRGSAMLGQSFTLSDGVASATVAAAGSASATHLSGTFSVSASAKPVTFSLDLAQGELEGVYTDQLSEGLVTLIVLESGAHASVTAQGAFHDLTAKIEIEQVTPLNPLDLTAKGIAVDILVNGAKQQVFVTPAVGD
jgi:hypothetical protein